MFSSACAALVAWVPFSLSSFSVPYWYIPSINHFIHYQERVTAAYWFAHVAIAGNIAQGRTEIARPELDWSSI